MSRIQPANYTFGAMVIAEKEGGRDGCRPDQATQQQQRQVQGGAAVASYHTAVGVGRCQIIVVFQGQDRAG